MEKKVTTGDWTISKQKYCIFYRHTAQNTKQHKWFIFGCFQDISISCPLCFQFGSILCIKSNNIIAFCHPIFIWTLSEQSHQTFNMISFKPIIVINLCEWVDHLHWNHHKRACTMRSFFSSVYFLIKNSIEFGVVNLIESNENHSIDIYFEMLLSIGPTNIP